MYVPTSDAGVRCGVVQRPFLPNRAPNRGAGSVHAPNRAPHRPAPVWSGVEGFGVEWCGRVRCGAVRKGSVRGAPGSNRVQ